jgi:hypothetical protein
MGLTRHTLTSYPILTADSTAIGFVMTKQPFFIPAILLILISIPLIFGLIPKNRFYGIRTAKAMSDDSTWYRSNRFGAWAFIFSCMTYLLVAWKLPAVGPGGTDFSLWLLHFAVFALPLPASLILTIRYTKKL